MRDLKVPEVGPKRKLLDATERLVVEKGFDLVSVRDITGAIKANVAAVNYHFGSREGLMDLVMLHVMEAVNAARVEALENAARLESRGPVEEIVSAYVNAVLAAADRVEMDLPFFLKLVGRVMVFPAALMSPVLSTERKQVTDLYLQALAGAAPQSADLEAAWAFFEAGLGQSLVNLRDDLSPSVQGEQWIRFGVRGFGAPASATLPVVDAPIPAVVKKQVEAPPIETPIEESAPTPEPAKPRAKAPKAPAKKQDDQNMLFDL